MENTGPPTPIHDEMEEDAVDQGPAFPKPAGQVEEFFHGVRMPVASPKHTRSLSAASSSAVAASTSA